MAWRLLGAERPDDPPLSVAFEEALLESVGAGRAPPTVRFWTHRAVVVLGRHQCPALELHPAPAAPVPWVRRLTGGGAVFHDEGNLNVSVVTPERPPGLHAGFAVLGEALVQALGRLGLTGRFVPRNTVCVGERKVAGLAAALGVRGALYHASLLVAADLARLEEVLRPAVTPRGPVRAVRSVRRPVANLADLAGRPLARREVEAAVQAGIEAVYGVRCRPAEPAPEEEARAAQLVGERYATRAWRLGPCRRCGCAHREVTLALLARAAGAKG